MSGGVSIEQKRLILDKVSKYFPSIEIFFFGSRFHETHKSSSDLDLCLRAEKALNVADWSKLSAELTDSDLPFKVDLLDWARITPEFQNAILKGHEVWHV